MIETINNLKFACFDTETTGLDPKQGGKICEIAVSVSQDGKLLNEYSTLINPEMTIAPDVTAIHGITNEMVKEAPTFRQVTPKLLEVFDGCVIVAHNARFDMKFLESEFEQCGLVFPPHPVVDTLKLAQKSGLFAHNNLGIVAQAIGINNQGWHRAMADTKMCEQILYHFLTMLMDSGISTLEQLQNCQFKKWKDLGIITKEKVYE